jgi:hypothetical protein
MNKQFQTVLDRADDVKDWYLLHQTACHHCGYPLYKLLPANSNKIHPDYRYLLFHKLGFGLSEKLTPKPVPPANQLFHLREFPIRK